MPKTATEHKALELGTLERGDEYQKIWESAAVWKAVDKFNIGHRVKEFPGARFRRPTVKLHRLL